MSIIHEKSDVYCVWTKTGHRPRYFHETYESAAKEAQRLAQINPGKKFLVMHYTDKFHIPTEATGAA